MRADCTLCSVCNPLCRWADSFAHRRGARWGPVSCFSAPSKKKQRHPGGAVHSQSVLSNPCNPRTLDNSGDAGHPGGPCHQVLVAGAWLAAEPASTTFGWCTDLVRTAQQHRLRIPLAQVTVCAPSSSTVSATTLRSAHAQTTATADTTRWPVFFTKRPPPRKRQSMLPPAPELPWAPQRRESRPLRRRLDATWRRFDTGSLGLCRHPMPTPGHPKPRFIDGAHPEPDSTRAAQEDVPRHGRQTSRQRHLHSSGRPRPRWRVGGLHTDLGELDLSATQVHLSPPTQATSASTWPSASLRHSSVTQREPFCDVSAWLTRRPKTRPNAGPTKTKRTRTTA